MRKLRDLRIDIERWIYRTKIKIQVNRMEKRRIKAISEADQMKKVTGKRHYVLLVEGKYLVKNRYDKMIINKTLPRMAKLTNAEFDKFTVYHTK